jgi:uncharacterized membrane protein YhaH (DUF805 family)
MAFIYWWKTAFRKYADFEGRASRSEFWYFVLGNFLLEIFASMIDRIVDPNYYAVSGILALVLLVPKFATAIRRLHDTNHSGWNLLWAFLPIIGLIILIVFYVKESDPTENRFGARPSPLVLETV